MLGCDGRFSGPLKVFRKRNTRMFVKLFGSCSIEEALLASRITETGDVTALDGLSTDSRRRVAMMTAYLKNHA